MAISPKRVAKLIWAGINAASVVAWLVSLGVPAVIASAAGIVARSLGASWPLVIPLVIGLFLVSLSGMLAALGARRRRAIAEHEARTLLTSPEAQKFWPDPEPSPSLRVPADVPSNRDWVSPGELGNYLDSINRTMEAHGFGRNPGLPPPPRVNHRPGCPENVSRIETYETVREADGIEVEITHCLDCGATHYSHGDTPKEGWTPPPLEPAKPTRSSASPPTPSEEADALVRRGQEHERTLHRLETHALAGAERLTWPLGNGPAAVVRWLQDVDRLARQVDTEVSRSFASVTDTKDALATVRLALDVLRSVQAKLNERPVDRVALLRAEYDKGNALRPTLIWPIGGIPDTPDDAADQAALSRDAVCEWAKGAWRVLRDHFQGHENDFYPGGLIDDSIFELMCAREIARRGGDYLGYFEERMGMLRDLLRRFDAPRPPAGEDDPGGTETARAQLRALDKKTLSGLIHEATHLRGLVPPLDAQTEVLILPQLAEWADEWEGKTWAFLNSVFPEEAGHFTHSKVGTPSSNVAAFLDARIAELRTILARV